MKQFVQHKKKWFLARVGELVDREYTSLTPAAEKATGLNKTIQICSNAHALACYNYHLDKKVNFQDHQNHGATHTRITDDKEDKQVISAGS
jgi:hypothetical protein